MTDSPTPPPFVKREVKLLWWEILCVSEELPAATFVAILFSCSDGACGQMLQQSPVGKEELKGGEKTLLFPANFITYSLRLILSSGLFPFNLKLKSNFSKQLLLCSKLLVQQIHSTVKLLNLDSLEKNKVFNFEEKNWRVLISECLYNV